MRRPDWEPGEDEGAFPEPVLPTIFRTVPDLEAPSSWDAASAVPDDDVDLWVSELPEGTERERLGGSSTAVDLMGATPGEPVNLTTVEITPWQSQVEQESASDQELPDPQALFLQMQGGARAEELPDPEALFLQMQGGARAEELPDPEALFLQMQGGVREEELPDSEALFLQMQGGARAEELPDPEALFLQMQGGARAEELPDPEALFLQMQGGARAEELPDPEALFLQMQGGARAEELPEFEVRSEDSFEEIVFPELHLLDDDHEPLQPAAELPLPATLFEQLSAAQEPDDEPFSLKLVRPEPLELPVLPDPQELFFQLQAQELAAAADETLDTDEADDDVEEFSLPEESEELEPEDKGGFFSRIKAKFSREKRSSLESVLPDPAELFRRLELDDDEPPVEPQRLSAGGGWIAPELVDPPELRRSHEPQQRREFEALPEGEACSVAEPWVAPVEPAQPAEPTLLPLDDVLDAFRAELEAEEKERLDADLLGDLSGPERFAETVSDLEFHVGTFFTAPVEPSPPAKSTPSPATPSPAVPSPEARRREPRAVPPMEEPELPAMLSSPEPVKGASPPLSSPVPAASSIPVAPASGGMHAPPLGAAAPSALGAAAPSALGAAAPSALGAAAPSALGAAASSAYQAAPRPVKRKSASTLVMSEQGEETVRVGASSGLGQRLAKYRERKKAMSRHTLSVFTRQLAAMTKAGIPLHQSIAFCAESTPEAGPMLEDICAKIESGYSLSGALREYPESFDAVYTGLVHTGELSGRLNEITAKLADILEKEIQLRKRMISVVTYPSVLFGVSLLGTLGFIFFILPQITPLFMDLNVELPWPTKVLLSLRTVLLPLSLSIVTALLLVWLFKGKLLAYVRAKPDLERRLAYLPISIPILGPVYEKMVTARVLYSLATMLEVGVTMNQALARSEGTSGNAYISYRLARARMDLADGASVTECFQANRVFPDTALHLIAAGEESARLIDMFGFVAQHFDEDVEEAMNAAAGMLEPLIMVVMGAIVGFITIAAALPTVQILEKFG